MVLYIAQRIPSTKMHFMKNIVLASFLSTLLFNCSSYKDNNENAGKPVGIPYKTANPNTPYIYKNGYKNYSFLKSTFIQEKDTLTLNELKFNAVINASYTKKIMFFDFGIWSTEVKTIGEQHIVYVWEKIKLLKNENKLFTIFAHGDENRKEIFASVSIIDAENNDCLDEKSIYRDKIIDHFSNAIQNVTNDLKLYNYYWDTVEKQNYSKKTSN